MKFDSYHPTINLIFFVAVVLCAVFFTQPIFIAIGYLSAFAYSVKLNGLRALVFNLILIPVGVAFVSYYVGFNHFGITVFGQNSIGNNYTLESIVFGITLVIRGATVLMWLSCVHAVFTADKVVYLLGRISPRASLLFAIILRMVPRIKAQMRLLNTAQSAIGRGIDQGGIFRRIRNAVRLASMTLTWTLESFVIASDSMRSRGYLLRGRTAFSLYRFDYRDRAVVIFLFTCMALILCGILFDQTTIIYNPEIIMNRMTPLSSVFYSAYAVFCLTPLGLQCRGEFKFKHCTARMEESSSHAA